MFKASMIASALLLALAGARAAPQDLTVRGLITPESCTLELGNHGALDYGTLSASTVRTYEDADPFYLLPSRRISLTVTCPSATAVALAATDNRAASKPDFTAGDSLGFGLGRSGAQPVGVFRIQVVDMRLVRTPDGVPEPAVKVPGAPGGRMPTRASSTTRWRPAMARRRARGCPRRSSGCSARWRCSRSS
jgi:hypothetical protein